jgi:hypothetical protein
MRSSAATKTIKTIRTSRTLITKIGMKDSDVHELSKECLNDNLLIHN